jgi:hypothetical protein
LLAIGSRGGQFRNVVEDAFCEGDAHYAGRFVGHSSVGISMPSLASAHRLHLLFEPMQLVSDLIF